MANNNSANQDYQNNADGFRLGGGTTKRDLTVTGADITLTGSGSNTHTFPSSTGTLVNEASVIDVIYPVGSIYIETTGTNPGTTFGVGTWTAFGAGRVPVGLDSGDTDFDTVEETGGSKTHTLTVGEMPSHTHAFKSNSGGSTNFNQRLSGQSSGGAGVSGGTLAEDTSFIDNKGGGSAHNNVQPYIVVHMWKRTA